METINLDLYRKWYTHSSTTGEMFIDNVHFCFTLEDVCRDLNRDGVLAGPSETKVWGQTCIPAGKYDLVIDMSTRFKRLMPHILNVPGFDGIRIHNGNTSKDTDGCILLGNEHSTDFISHSVDTFDAFYQKLKVLLTKYKATITIHDAKI